MLATAVLVLASLGLQVRGETNCPGVDEVRARLSAIVPFSEDQRLAERAIIDRRGDTIRVVLESAEGDVLGERELGTDASCDELAQVVAVVLAAWLGDAHPELVARLPSTSKESSAESAAKPDAEHAPSTAAISKTDDTSHARRVEPEERVASVPRSKPRLIGSAAIGISAGQYGQVASAKVGLAWMANKNLGWELSFGMSGERKQPLGTGEVRWSRWPLTTGPLLRFESERAALELQAGPALAWLRLQGNGYDKSSAFSDVSYGVFGALRFGWKTGVLMPFFSASPHVWLRRATAVAIESSSTELKLPTAELWLLVGLAVEPFRRRAR